MKALLDIIARHRAGSAVGIPSVCSAHPDVLDAALIHARDGGQPVLIEATSNQVNQHGGYTGMRPADFHAHVMDKADRAGLPRDRVLLGGDHLGPNCWQHESSGSAMVQADVLINDYVAAGFRKIHLDCSMPCADDPAILPDGAVAERAARLCAIAEDAWRRCGGEAPVYIVGTEVPVPGGAKEEVELQVTRPEAVAATVAAHRGAFLRSGLEDAWQRVVGLVVQPGVEFGHHDVVDFRPDKAQSLSAAIEALPSLVYEAHSTDYQTCDALAALVRAHFAILKVGPGLTYALRETLWALSFIEDELLGTAESSGLRRCVLDVMRAMPRHWDKYYVDDSRLTLDLQYSLSDRMRYYWAQPGVQEACAALMRNLGAISPDGAIPLALLGQYLPLQHEDIRAGRLVNCAPEILRAGVTYVLRRYAHACGQLPHAGG